MKISFFGLEINYFQLRYRIETGEDGMYRIGKQIGKKGRGLSDLVSYGNMRDIFIPG